MRNTVRAAAAVLVLLLALGLWRETERCDLGDLSLRFFSELFRSPEAREVFGLEEEEAKAVFGEQFETAYL